MILLIFCLLHSSLAFTQSKPAPGTIQQDQLVDKELGNLVESKSFRQKLKRDYPAVDGFVEADLILDFKGKPISLFIRETDIGDIHFLEFLTDQILKHGFAIRLDRGACIKTKQKLIISKY